MTSIYEKTQGTVFSVSAEAATEANPADATWLSASCSTKELSFTGGRKMILKLQHFARPKKR